MSGIRGWRWLAEAGGTIWIHPLPSPPPRLPPASCALRHLTIPRLDIGGDIVLGRDTLPMLGVDALLGMLGWEAVDLLKMDTEGGWVGWREVVVLTLGCCWPAVGRLCACGPLPPHPPALAATQATTHQLCVPRWAACRAAKWGSCTSSSECLLAVEGGRGGCSGLASLKLSLLPRMLPCRPARLTDHACHPLRRSNGMGAWSSESLQATVDWLEGLDFVCYLAGNGAQPGSGAASLARLTACWSPLLEYKHWSNVVRALPLLRALWLRIAWRAAKPPCTTLPSPNPPSAMPPRQVCVGRSHPLYPEMERMTLRYASHRATYYSEDGGSGDGGAAGGGGQAAAAGRR